MTDSYVCIDLETTGLDPRRDKIIEIGAVRIERGETVGEWETFVNPGRKLPERIVELTGIHDGDLSGGETDRGGFAGIAWFFGGGYASGARYSV